MQKIDLSKRPDALSVVTRKGMPPAISIEDVVQDKRFADFRGLRRSFKQLLIDNFCRFNKWKRGVYGEEPPDELKSLYVLLPAQSREKNPAELVVDNDWVDIALGCLTQRMRIVIYGLFFENRSAIEISEMFGVSNSRVCQIKKAALKRMRKCLGESNGEI